MGAVCSKRSKDNISAAVLAKWTRLIVKLYKLRKQQRYWAYLGHHLQSFPKLLRNRLQNQLRNE